MTLECASLKYNLAPFYFSFISFKFPLFIQQLSPIDMYKSNFANICMNVNKKRNDKKMKQNNIFVHAILFILIFFFKYVLLKTYLSYSNIKIIAYKHNSTS